MNRTIIIAEAGVNHNGDPKIAERMIDVAAEAGADMIKFQTFHADQVISRNAPKADYQKETTNPEESQLDMARKLELSFDAFRDLKHRCDARRIAFLSTPADFPSIDFLAGIGLDTLKVPSGEITNLPYLRRIGRLNKRLFVSTGMANLGEVEAALDILIDAGTRKEKITLLHCHTDYPTRMRDVNLKAMITLREAFKVAVGYSDHTLGIEVPIAAVALGAAVVEKHFTLDNAMPGPDHRASLNPAQLGAMIEAIRNIEKALGDGIKKPSATEEKLRGIVRRSIVAAVPIRKGETLTEKNLTAKRPGTGINPMQWDRIVGLPADRDYDADSLIDK